MESLDIIDAFLTIENDHCLESKQVLLDFDPDLFALFNDIEFAYRGILACLDVHQAYSIEANKELLSQKDFNELQKSLTVISIVALIIYRHFIWSATDLRRLRLTSAMQHLRIQIEGIGLWKLFKKERSLTADWFNIRTDKEGIDFYHKNNKNIINELDQELKEAYERCSGMAQHVRLKSVINGIDFQGLNPSLNLKEYSDEEPSFFIGQILWLLDQQIRISFEAHSLLPKEEQQSIRNRVANFKKRIDRLWSIFAQKFPGKLETYL